MMRNPFRFRSHAYRVPVAALAIGFGALYPHVVSAQDPEPFRRGNDLTGRPFAYSNRSAIHRLTFDYRPREIQQWILDPTGFRTAFGSTSSRQFVVHTDWRRLWSMQASLDTEARLQRSEDLDGDYERILTGFGYRPAETWRIAVLGDIVANKKNIDFHLESQWVPSPRHRLRVAGLAVDFTYRSKADCGSYDTMPYTYFAQYTGRPWPGTLINAWINVNPDLAFNSFEHDLLFKYEQTTAGLDLTLPLDAEWRVTIEGRHTSGERRWEPSDSNKESGRFNRRFYKYGAEIWHEPEDRISAWYGLRLISLDESQHGAMLGHADQRRETIAYGGILVPVTRWGAIFRPGLYFSYLDKNTTTGPEKIDPDKHGSGVPIFKAALPLTFAFAEGRSLTLSASFISDRQAGFGGGNIRGVFPF